MGIARSGPSKEFPFPTVRGKNDGFAEEVVIHLSAEGFSPCEVCIREGECILFEWEEELPCQAFNVIQVSGPELTRVPGGYCSGGLTKTGSFKVCLGRRGLFRFQSESMPDKLKTLNVQVFEKLSREVKITSSGFETQLVNIQEGEAVSWKCENEDFGVQCLVQEMEYCFKHGGFVLKKSRAELKPTFERTFHTTGLYFFYLVKNDGHCVEEFAANLICVVKVTQRNREFSVHLTEDSVRPDFISATVQDRIWLDCSLGKIQSRTILDAYIYKDGLDSSHLVSARLPGTTNSRLADLISHQFTEPGLYYYVYIMADQSEKRGCVVVQPNPTEHVVDIADGRFNPDLCTVKQGERVWWTLSDEEGPSWYLRELDGCTSAKGLPARRKSSNSGCCKRAKDQAHLIGCLGVLSRQFDEIGVFTYCLQEDLDSVSCTNSWSIVVQKNVKHHAIRVRDQGFTPRILNVHPGDWVWWQWQDTKRQHNIVQVSHQRIAMAGGLYSGKPTHSPSAFSTIFTDLGIFYFASNGLPELFGAVVVTPEPQVHRIDVTSQGIHPDPLNISVNDCVAWVWCDGERYDVQEISDSAKSSEQTGTIRCPVNLGKRNYSRVIQKPGVYHFLFTAHTLTHDEQKTALSDTVVHISTVLVDPISYSCIVGVAADGFRPSTLTIEKSQSVLWTWENQGIEEHNILHVRPPQADQPLARVRGLSAFDSGPVTTTSTFFHTFDVPGKYFVTSEGTERQLCVIDVQENAAYVAPPKIWDTERDGGNAEKGHRVFLECGTPNAEIYYTVDGSYPMECNPNLKPYNKKKGVVLSQEGLVVVRAIAKKDGWVTSQVYNSNRFKVIEGDSILPQESSDEDELLLETDPEPAALKKQIFQWHWFSCRPSISLELVCDNTFNLDITLGNTADISWIKGFQLYLNGTAYGGWFGPQYRGLVISGLIGGKVYHVVLVVFPIHESYEPQLSNEVVISCPVRSSSGGPLVSLEASTTPQSLVILWPAFRDPSMDEVTTYSVFINGQSFGDQIVSEPESDYCRVLFESSLENEVYILCVACHSSGSDVLLYSNEVEFSLPIPPEILSALENPRGQSDSLERDRLDGGTPARELLLVAERINTALSVPSESSIEKLSVKSSFGKLQTIFEGQKVDENASRGDVSLKDRFDQGEGDELEAKANEAGPEVESFNEKGRRVGVDEQLNDAENEANDVLANQTLKHKPGDAETVEQTTGFESLGNVEDGKLSQNHSLSGNQESVAFSPHEAFQPVSEGFPKESKAVDELVGESNFSVFEDPDDIVLANEPVITTNVVAANADDTNSTPKHASSEEEEGNAFGIIEQADSEFGSYEGKQELSPEDVGGPASSGSMDGYEVSENSSKGHSADVTNGRPVCEDNVRGHAMVDRSVDCHAKEEDETLSEKPKTAGDNSEEVIPSKSFELATSDVLVPPGKARENVEQTSGATPEASLKALNDLASDHAASEMKETHSDTSEDDYGTLTGDGEQATVHVAGVLSEEPLEDDVIPNKGCVRESSTPKIRKTEDYVSEEESLMESPEATVNEPKESLSGFSSKQSGGHVSGKTEDTLDEFQISGVCKSVERNEKILPPVKDDAVEYEKLLNLGIEINEKENIRQRSKDTPDDEGENHDFKLIKDEIAEESWSTSSSRGSSAEYHEERNDVVTAVMPTFGETDDAADARSLSLGIMGDNEGVKHERDAKTEAITNAMEEKVNQQELETRYEGDMQDISAQRLPRPLLVIKGTTPATVTLEWEWTLLPEQIAGSDIVYTVLILGSKFQSNINSNFCFDFDESPAKSMWANQSDALLQHAWRTTNTVIEIKGLKQRYNYRIAVLGQLMPLAHDSLSRVIFFTMPGPPKSPVIHVTDLKHREVTLSWRTPASYGDANIVGYRLLKDGMVYCENLDGERTSVTVNGLKEGTQHRFNLLAVTCHSVGDSKLSSSVNVFCPTPPMSPQIYHTNSATFGCICIAWKRDEPASTATSEEQATCSDIVFLNDMPHGECPLTGETDILTGEHTYTIPNLEVGRKYLVHVKSYLNPRVIDIGGGKILHVCGCYSDSSNVLDLFCAGPPSAPVVRVSRIDQSGVTLSWSRSSEFGGVTLGGYILQVNGHWSGEIVPADQCQTKLTGFKAGDVIRARLTAITYDIAAPFTQSLDHYNGKSRYFARSYEQQDSGVESSSSLLSKVSADETKQYACSADSILVIQYSKLVRTVSSVEVLKLGCRSALITWLLDQTADRSVAPDLIRVFCWRTMEGEESAMKYIVTENPFTIKGLESQTEYHVMLECIAPHVNDDNYSDHPINVARSQPISFVTASPPGPLRNIYVVSATEVSIKMAWENPAVNAASLAATRVKVGKRDQDIFNENLTIQLSPETRAYTFESLTPKTEYTFILEAVTEEDLFDTHEASAGSVTVFSAFTNGLDPPDNLKICSRAPTSIAVTWEHAVVYGMSIIQHYRVHYVPNRQLRKKSRGRFLLTKDTGKVLVVESESSTAELCGLDPGTVYRIVVEAVAGIKDYSYDEDFESDESGTNSLVSSTLSENLPEMQQLYLSGPLLACTSAPPEPPVLLVSGFTATQVKLSWRKPLVLGPVTHFDEIPCGRVRRLKGYRVEVNGRVHTRLAADKTNMTLKKCKSGIKYSCVLVAITGPEGMDACQRKNLGTLDSAINDTDTDEEVVSKPLSECLEESASDPVEVTLPRQDWNISLSAKYSANKPAGSLRDSPCSESGDEEGGVVVRWIVKELSGDVRGFRLIWYSSKLQDKSEVLLPGDATGYEIWSVLLSCVYTMYLEVINDREEAMAVFGPLHCQTPGPPAPPWIWCRSLSPYQFTIEWNEPVTYGDVHIRAYQVFLNERRLEKLVDRRQRRVTIHCQSSSLYRVWLVALGSDLQYGDSSPSNVLKLCTPLAEEQAMTYRPSGRVKRPTFDISIHVSSIANTSISFEWSHPPEVVDTADHYIIKWSSVLKPQVEELTLPLSQTSHVIDDCMPGTNHFLVVAAVNPDGDLFSRSKQHTVQTSAPVKKPCLEVTSCLQSGITVRWQKPTTFGDAEIDYYQFIINGALYRELDNDCTYFNFTECEPCEEYSFHLKAVSIKPDCNSEWSESLILTCPGAERPLITRVQSEEVNCIKVGWERPVLRGDAQVGSYKVYFLQDKEGLNVTLDEIVKDPEAVHHGPLPCYTTDDKLFPIPPDSWYWVVLQVQLMPGDCQPVYSQPIKTRAAVSPDPPLISLKVEGVEARRRLEERICQLSIKRDSLHRMIHLLQSSVVVKGSKIKDMQIVKASDNMLEVDSELADVLESIEEYTGTVSCVVRWKRPYDDGDAVVSGYQLYVDGNHFQKPLPLSALEAALKLPVSCHELAVQTLTGHPIGPSPLSNVVKLPSSKFLPFVLFCYFDVHKREEGWPRTGCCSWNDSHSFELKHRERTPSRVFVPLGVLARRIPCPVFNVMDVFNAVWRPLAPSGINKMVALLFWTKWCYSSQKSLDYFLQVAEELTDKYKFITCCVRSNEPVTSHRQSLANALMERNWRKTSDCVTHTCACNLQSQRSRTARRNVITDPDVCQVFGLVGVPTIILLDSSGYISWHGRCSCRDVTSFRALFLHAFSQVSHCSCPVTGCLHCEFERENKCVSSLSEEIDDTDEQTSGLLRQVSIESNTPNPQRFRENGDSDEHSSRIRRKVSIDSHTLYQRLHGPNDDENVSSQKETIKTKYLRPKTAVVGRSARLSGYNRSIGSNEPIQMRSQSFTAYDSVHSSRPVTARPESTILQPRMRTAQRTSQSSSKEISFPLVTRQRGKRTHSSERNPVTRVKTKISVEDFPLW
ncbi:uncharacterized protein [Montipora foliosa]|uniref:uncharacterized protein n=1 Tax=Montipora foliosa TaxID=591990 RepID=UPI0035F12610